MGWELRTVGSVGASLALDCHAVVVVIAVAGDAFAGAFEPVAGVDLHGGLGGVDPEHSSRFVRGQHGGLVYDSRFVAVDNPAVVVAFTVSQSREIGVNVAPSSLATVKSIGVPSTGAISPVGTSVLSVGSQREALSHKVWASAERSPRR